MSWFSPDPTMNFSIFDLMGNEPAFPNKPYMHDRVFGTGQPSATDYGNITDNFTAVGPELSYTHKDVPAITQAAEGPPQPSGSISGYGANALKAGTLGADNPDFGSYQQLAMKNPMSEIMGIVGNMQKMNQQQGPAPGQAYMHPYIAQLMSGGR